MTLLYIQKTCLYFLYYYKIVLFKMPKAKLISYIQTRLDQVFKLLLFYNTYINKNIQSLIADLNKYLAMPVWKKYNAIDEANLLIYLANWLWQKESININHFPHLSNNYELKKLETYKKAIVSNQTEE